MNEVLAILDHLKSAVVRDGQLVAHEFEAEYQKLRAELTHAFEHGPREKNEPKQDGPPHTEPQIGSVPPLPKAD